MDSKTILPISMQLIVILSNILNWATNCKRSNMMLIASTGAFYITAIFNNSEVKRFKKAKEKNQRENVKIGWVGVFTFPYILKIAKFYGHTQLSDDEIVRLKDVRNRVYHSDRNLITQYNDIQWLVDTYQLTELLIKSAKFSETRKIRYQH